MQRHLQRRISSYYKMGNIGLLNVTFSAQTLPELLKFHDAYQSLIAYDQNVIAIYRKSIKNLEQASKTLNLEKSVLSDFIDRAVAEQKIIDATKKDKETLLLHIQTQTKLHQQAIEEMEKATAELSASLLALKTKEQASNRAFWKKRAGFHCRSRVFFWRSFNRRSPIRSALPKKLTELRSRLQMAAR